jgi:hypothetical protein
LFYSVYNLHTLHNLHHRTFRTQALIELYKKSN